MWSTVRSASGVFILRLALGSHEVRPAWSSQTCRTRASGVPARTPHNLGTTSALSAISESGRISMPGERAAAVAFLAGDETWYIHGVALDVNGSRFMA